MKEGLERSGLPNEWSWVPLGELVADVKNGLYKRGVEYGSGCGTVRIDDFYDGRIRDQGVFKRVRVEASERQAYALQEGDLLVNRVSKASQVDELVRCIDGEIRRAEYLLQSILKRAFSGKLVPQDPDDEPASALLQRIRAEQEKGPKSAKGRREANA